MLYLLWRRRRQILKVCSRSPRAWRLLKIQPTNLSGRLGYACLNTVLRALKPDPTFCSRTCRLDTIRKNGLDYAKELGRQNARDLSKLIQWNEENKIQFLRVSSEMFPFASHAEWGYELEYAKEELKVGCMVFCVENCGGLTYLSRLLVTWRSVLGIG